MHGKNLSVLCGQVLFDGFFIKLGILYSEREYGYEWNWEKGSSGGLCLSSCGGTDSPGDFPCL